jgi:hypothetical protein
MDMSQVQWGDVATWIAAVSTAAALGAAIVAAKRAGQVLQVERDRDRDRDVELERWQADAVAAWPDRGESSSRIARSEGAYIANNSALPVYDAIVRWFHPDATGYLQLRLEQHAVAVVPPGGEYVAARGAFRAPWNRGTLDTETGQYVGSKDASARWRGFGGSSWQRAGERPGRV